MTAPATAAGRYPQAAIVPNASTAIIANDAIKGTLFNRYTHTHAMQEITAPAGVMTAENPR